MTTKSRTTNKKPKPFKFTVKHEAECLGMTVPEFKKHRRDYPQDEHYRYASDVEFERTYHRKYLQGQVELGYYKGAILLTVRNVITEKGEHIVGLDRGSAWLRGKDFDELIAMLQDARRAWKKAHKRTLVLAAREDAEKAGKVAKRVEKKIKL
jgi:hypothetical protein